jgi:hypothetical protein
LSGSLLFFKLVQSEDFSYHHNKDLDKYTFSLEVSNETKGVSFVKRLFFNKVQFPIGFLEIRIGDKIKLVVRVQRGGKEETVIQSYEFDVRDDVLYSPLNSEPIPILSWIPSIISITLNYDGNTSSMTKLPQQ